MDRRAVKMKLTVPIHQPVATLPWNLSLVQTRMGELLQCLNLPRAKSRAVEKSATKIKVGKWGKGEKVRLLRHINSPKPQ